MVNIFKSWWTPTITIESPVNGDSVPHMILIKGRMRGINSCLQALVFSHDKRWYPQPPLRIEGGTFTGDVFCGSSVPAGEMYLIMVVEVQDQIVFPLDGGTIPGLITASNTVVVSRV